MLGFRSRYLYSQYCEEEQKPYLLKDVPRTMTAKRFHVLQASPSVLTTSAHAKWPTLLMTQLGQYNKMKMGNVRLWPTAKELYV